MTSPALGVLYQSRPLVYERQYAGRQKTTSYCDHTDAKCTNVTTPPSVNSTTRHHRNGERETECTAAVGTQPEVTQAGCPVRSNAGCLNQTPHSRNGIVVSAKTYPLAQIRCILHPLAASAASIPVRTQPKERESMPIHQVSVARTRLAALAVFVFAGSASAQLLQIGPSGNDGLVITNSSGALRVVAGHIVPGSQVAQWDFTLYGTAGNSYTFSMPSGPAGPTVGLDFLHLSGGGVSPTGNPLEFVFTPTGPFLNFSVLVQSQGQYYDGGIFPLLTFASTLNNASSTRVNVPLVLNPNAVATPIVLQGVDYSHQVDLFAGGSISGGDGATVSAPVTSAPGSTVTATGGSLTLGNGTAPIVLNGTVNVTPGATLNFVAASPAMLGGNTTIDHGTIRVVNAVAPSDAGQLVIATIQTQEASDAIDDFLFVHPTPLNDLVAGQAQPQLALMNAVAAELQAINQALGNSPTLEQQIELIQARADLMIEQAELAAHVQQVQAVAQLTMATVSLAGAFGNPVQPMQAFVASLSSHSTIEADLTVTSATALIVGDAGDIDHTNIVGSFTLRAGGTLAMEFATASGTLDTVSVTGDATFDAASVLRFDAVSGDPLDTPRFLQTFDLLTASSVTLNGVVVLTNDPNGMFFVPSVIDNTDGTQTLRLTAIPTPGAAALLAAATLTTGRRKRRAQ